MIFVNLKCCSVFKGFANYSGSHRKNAPDREGEGLKKVNGVS